MFHTSSCSARRLLGIALLVVLVATAGCAAGSNDAAPGGGDGAASNGNAATGDGVGSYYDDGDRVVVRESEMELQVDEFESAFRDVRAAARRNGGYVGDRSVSGDRGWNEGYVVVRVPPENFSDVRDAVAELGRLDDESVRVLDYTAQYEDREARLERLRSDESELERLLAQTDDAQEARMLRDDLSSVRNEIQQLERQQAGLERRQAMSTVRVEMAEPPEEKPPKNYESAFGFGDAFLEAFYGGLVVLKYAVVAVGYAVSVGAALLVLATVGVVLLQLWRFSFGHVVAITGAALGLERSPLGHRPGESGGASDGENGGKSSGSDAGGGENEESAGSDDDRER